MSFTTLYAELVVVGTGAMIWILLFFYSFFGVPSWLPRLAEPFPLVTALGLIPALSVIYLLGIVMANVSHHLFLPLEECLQCSKLKCSYKKVRNSLYTDPNAKGLIEDFEFRRSKVRICRGWFVNCFLIIIALAICSFEQRMRSPLALFWILSNGLVMIGAVVSWWTATTTELDWLQEYSSHLTETASTKGATSTPFCF